MAAKKGSSKSTKSRKNQPPADSTKSPSRWPTFISWFFGAAIFYYLLSRFAPCQPPTHYAEIEESYIQALQVAFRDHWQFGRDFVFTFGPWGFLYGGYDPATHWISVIVWTALAAVFCRAGWRAARGCFGNDYGAWAWLAAFSAIAGVTLFLNLDARLMAFALLLVLVHFFAEESPLTVTQGILAACVAFVGLIKFNAFIAGAFAILAVAVDTAWRQRRFPWILVVFGASVLMFWILAGQNPMLLPLYLRNSWLLAKGFADGMSVTAPTESRDICLFLAGAVLIGIMVIYAAWQRHRYFGILPAAAIAFIIFVAFKNGYVRNDGHEVAGTCELLLTAIAAQAMAWPVAQKKHRLAALATFVPVVFVFWFARASFNRNSHHDYLEALARTLTPGHWAAPLALLQGDERFKEVLEQNFSKFRNQYPLPQITGTVDAYPWNEEPLFARGLQCHPRPIIQSYSVYTPELQELNASFLRGAQAPENIFFSLQSIDEHLPAEDEGLSWPELLARYDIAESDASQPLLLKRRATPRHLEKIPWNDSSVAFDSSVALPTNGLIWAEMDIEKTLTGKIVSTLYKPPQLTLTLTLRNGKHGTFRLIPGMVRTGFLISPFIGDNKSFALLAAHNKSGALDKLETTSLAVSAAGTNVDSSCYQNPFHLRLYRLEFSSDAPGTNTLSGAKQSL